MEKKKLVPAVNSWGFYGGLIVTFLVVTVFKNWDPKVIPFDLFQFFFIKWDWNKLQEVPWFLLLVGPGLTIIVAVLTRNSREDNYKILNRFDGDIATSIKAGIFEEVSFRWLAFYLAIITFGAINSVISSLGDNPTWLSVTGNLWVSIPLFIIANLVGLVALTILNDNNVHGCVINLAALIIVVAWIIMDIAVALILFWSWLVFLYSHLIPIVDWLTQSKMHAYLYTYGWAVGAALVSVNWRFGQGHTYQGCLGLVDSWIFGMLMFWVTFNFGLPVAMIIHAAYDVLINAIRAVDAATELATS